MNCTDCWRWNALFASACIVMLLILTVACGLWGGGCEKSQGVGRAATFYPVNHNVSRLGSSAQFGLAISQPKSIRWLIVVSLSMCTWNGVSVPHETFPKNSSFLLDGVWCLFVVDLER